MGHTNLLCSQTHTFSIPQSHLQTRLPPARNASQREAGGLRGTSGQVTQITRIIQTGSPPALSSLRNGLFDQHQSPEVGGQKSEVRKNEEPATHRIDDL